jgi:ligand-binding sensor domain-containing protein
LIEGTQGQTWFGTDEAVRVYNGLDWTVWNGTHGLVGAPVNALCSTGDGIIYAGTQHGISRFEKGKWTQIFPPEGNVFWRVTNLALGSDQSLWASTPMGALRLSKQKTHLYSSAKIIDALKVIAPYVEGIEVDEHAIVRKDWVSRIGVSVTEAGSEDETELVIYQMAEKGPAARAGLRVGDRILSVDGATSGLSLASVLGGVGQIPLQ